MADKRRRRPGRPARRVPARQPPQGPQIVHTPGLAKQMLRELAPLLAEEGIDIDNTDTLDPNTLQQALNRAVERRNLALFTPVGPARDIAVTTLRLLVEAVAEGNAALAGAILDQVRPESPDHSTATVAGCIGLALGLLDTWLTGHHPSAPSRLAAHSRLPDGDWFGKRAAADVLALAAKGRAFRSLDILHLHHSGQELLYGSILALTAATQAWAQHAGTPTPELARTVIE